MDGPRTHPAQRPVVASEATRGAIRLAVTILLANTVLLAVFGSTSAAVLGSFAVVIHLYFLDFDGDPRERLIGHGVTTLVGVVAVAIGTWTAHPLWLAVVAAFAVSATFAFARVFRGYVARSAVGLQGAFFLPLMVPATTSELPELVGAWLVGSVIAVAAAAVLLPHRRSGVVRRATAEWLTTAAALARALASGQPADESLARLRTAHTRLLAEVGDTRVGPGAVGRRERALAELVARTGWSMPVAMMLRASGGEEDARLHEMSAAAFGQAAAFVGDGPVPADVVDIEDARARDLAALAATSRDDLTSAYSARVMSIAASMQLFLAGATRGRRLPVPEVGGIADETPAAIARAALRPRSVWLWNAVRTGLATAVCVLLVRELGVSHGLWVVIVALACIQGSFSARSASRDMVAMAGGAALGVVVAGALLAARPPYLVFVVLLPVTAFLAKATAARSPFVAQLAYTPFALVNVAVLGWPTQPGLAIVRVEDVALGALVAVLATVAVFPAGLRRLLRRRADEAEQWSSTYLAAAVEAARGGCALDDHARERCVAAVTSFESAVAAAGVQRGAADTTVAAYGTVDALARDRLVGGDACADLAARRRADPAMAPVADAFADWWTDNLPAATGAIR